MLRTFKFSVPAAGTSLYTLCGSEIDRCRNVLIQAPMENDNTVYFGEKGREFGRVLNGSTVSLDVSNMRDIHVLGTITDSLIVIVC
jgi:hypothetical protein